ncbi:MAG: hypothetical protein VX017_10695, partial [Pseudomonadota bacterium]|nr:hypothetical protein [Pseudomonadota bacterium]
MPSWKGTGGGGESGGDGAGGGGEGNGKPAGFKPSPADAGKTTTEKLQSVDKNHTDSMVAPD